MIIDNRNKKNQRVSKMTYIWTLPLHGDQYWIKYWGILYITNDKISHFKFLHKENGISVKVKASNIFPNFVKIYPLTKIQSQSPYLIILHQRAGINPTTSIWTQTNIFCTSSYSCYLHKDKHKSWELLVGTGIWKF